MIINYNVRLSRNRPSTRPGHILSLPLTIFQQDEGKSASHVDVDNKDRRSLANRVEAEKKHEKVCLATVPDPAQSTDIAKEEEAREAAPKPDPRAAALSHGNEPSRGAKIDASIEMEEEAELAKKDAAKEQSKQAHK